jgi:hypothetical protein
MKKLVTLNRLIVLLLVLNALPITAATLMSQHDKSSAISWARYEYSSGLKAIEFGTRGWEVMYVVVCRDIEAPYEGCPARLVHGLANGEIRLYKPGGGWINLPNETQVYEWTDDKLEATQRRFTMKQFADL